METRTIKLTEEQINLIQDALHIAEKSLYEAFKREINIGAKDFSAICKAENLREKLNQFYHVRENLKNGKFDA